MRNQLPVPLDDAALEDFGRALDAIRREITASLGEPDRRYIRRAIAVQRTMELGGRLVIFASLPLMPAVPLFLGAIGLGTASLAAAKILENMEIGHNVMHGQWDWMQDPNIHSATWEWDNVCPADQWRHSHNLVHHTWTNVIGRDRDVGYDISRVSEKQPWRPAYLAQPLYSLLSALLFEWGVALHDIDLSRVRRGEETAADLRRQLAAIGRKAGRQVVKDYLLWPLLAGPFFLPVLLANATANLVRNLWSFAIIYCGHFPDGAHFFTEAEVAGETRAGWYLRQVLGSCNISGGRLFHLMSGNLSHQIEHHLFPDMPSNRYREVAPRVRALCARHGIPYNTGSFGRQLGTAIRTIVRLARPPRTGAQSLPA
jgi:fatty acid desaturase